jgi:hypothetical protein
MPGLYPTDLSAGWEEKGIDQISASGTSSNMEKVKYFLSIKQGEWIKGFS